MIKFVNEEMEKEIYNLLDLCSENVKFSVMRMVKSESSTYGSDNIFIHNVISYLDHEETDIVSIIQGINGYHNMVEIVLRKNEFRIDTVSNIMIERHNEAMKRYQDIVETLYGNEG